MNTMKSGKWLLSVVVPVLLVGCQSAQRMAGPQTGGNEISRLTSAYLAVAQPRQDPYASTRLPIRRARKRNLKVLTKQCEELLTDVEAWDGDARLTSVDAAERDDARDAVGTFRESLRDLKTAADTSNIPAVRTQYASVMASYQRVVQTTGTGD